MLAASGDSGAADVKLDESTYYPFPVTSWPDSDPLVTAVGGTQLHVTATGSGFKPAAPTAWNDTYNRAANEFAVGDAGPKAPALRLQLVLFEAAGAVEVGQRGVVGEPGDPACAAVGAEQVGAHPLLGEHPGV